jgi:glycogen debranching enzyme
VLGYSNNGLEMWAYPVQILKAYRVSFRPAETTTEIDGPAILRRITYSPESITRTYLGSDFIVREKLFVPLDEPGAIISYDVESNRPLNIVVRFAQILDLMWPASLGGQEINWDAASSSYVLSEPTHRFTAAIGSADIIAHDETSNSARRTSGEPTVAFTLRAGGKPHHGSAKVIIAANVAAGDRAALAKTLADSYAELERNATTHYAELQNEALQIETPDPAVNQAFAWAEVALDQAWVCNADLGCGSVGGYGPSRKARRPQYAWFFAGDELVAVRALLSEGQFSRAREVLEFIIKYQDQKTGMIWHELSQSASLLDWAGKYPYMYVHVDITFQYLSTVRAYLEATGDKDFLKIHWASMQAAYDYCRSLLDSKDGLPRIPANKEGGNEQDSLSDDLQLSAGWVEAAEDFAHMAASTGRDSEAAEARLAGQKAAASIAKRYWSKGDDFWVSGYTRSGAPVVDRDIGPSRVLAQALFSAEQRESVLDQLASSKYQTDWGTRGLPQGGSRYDPNSYSKGSVWGISTAAVASAFWDAHRPATALPIWNSLVPWSSLDSLGHMHEALAGDFYHEELESVPEQTWSSAAFLTTAVHNLLGLEVNGESNQISFSPHLPPAWDKVTLQHLRLRQAQINIVLTRSEDGLDLRLHNDGSGTKMVFGPEVPLGARLVDARLGNKAIPVSLEQHSQDTHVKVEFELPHGDTHLSIRYAGGVSLLPPITSPVPGDPSRGVKITGTHLNRQTYTIEVDFVPSLASTLELATPWTIKNVQGAVLKKVSPGLYQLELGQPKVDRLKPDESGADFASTSYQHATIVVSFSPEN